MRDVPPDEIVIEDDEITQLKTGLLTSKKMNQTHPPTLWYVLKNVFQLPRIT